MRFLLAAALLAGSAFSASAQTAHPATLEGQVIIPSATFAKVPADAPDNLKTAGKFTTSDFHREDKLGAIKAFAFQSAPNMPRYTGGALPVKGQPIQGMSGIKNMGDGTYYVLQDNGFGSKANSGDAALLVHHVKPVWAKNEMQFLKTIFLRDPDKKLPFRIVHEGTKERYLTGTDLDTESLQIVGGKMWIGDELGPYLVRLSLDGKVEAIFDTMVDGKLVRSPDNHALTMPASPALKMPAFTARRSKGFEGMAASKDGKFLYPMLEGALMSEGDKPEMEMLDGKAVLRILEFNVAEGKYTGRSWKYLLDSPTNAIGDFNLIDGKTALVAERDGGEGTPDKACAEGKPGDTCYMSPAKLKRIYKIQLSDENANGVATKLGYIDLLDVKDPKGVAKQGTVNGVYAMPFECIENVDVVDDTHIIVGNDNNYPYSAGRNPNKAEDTEFVLINVGDFLKK